MCMDRYMDSFNLQDFAANNFSQTRRCNTLDHYYSMAKRNLVYNEVDNQPGRGTNDRGGWPATAVAGNASATCAPKRP